ncbi:MAG: aminotransferase class IV, partial [Thermodesulfobacteriota bacterium]
MDAFHNDFPGSLPFYDPSCYDHGHGTSDCAGIEKKMRRDAVSRFLILNHEVLPTDKTDIFERIENAAVYEVIKVVKGIPLFFEEHMERMRNSGRASGIALRKEDREILDEISTLVEKNQCPETNAKLVCARVGEEEVFLTYCIATEDPGPQGLSKGVHTILVQAERKDPHVKRVRSSFRDRVRDEMEKAGAYETLLVDGDGFITEGVRSNLFFVKGNHLCTPPSERVLLGVTRKHVVDICEASGIEIREERLHEGEIAGIEAAFLTGTTVDVMPIGTIEDCALGSASHPMVRGI